MTSRIIDAVWFTTNKVTQIANIWIVLIDTGFWLKSYIWLWEGIDKKADAESIAQRGAPVAEKIARATFNVPDEAKWAK